DGPLALYEGVCEGTFILCVLFTSSFPQLYPNLLTAHPGRDTLTLTYTLTLQALPNTHTHTLTHTHTHTHSHTHTHTQTDRQPPNSSRSLSVYMHTNRHFSKLHNPIHLSISFPLLFSFYLLFPSLSLTHTHTTHTQNTHTH